MGVLFDGWCNGFESNHFGVSNRENCKKTICCCNWYDGRECLSKWCAQWVLAHHCCLCSHIFTRITGTACNVIHSTIAKLQTQFPEALIAISRDFNNVTLDSTLFAFFSGLSNKGKVMLMLGMHITITGCSKSNVTTDGDVARANQLNHFFNR